jgi:hypothetical protein
MSVGRQHGENNQEGTLTPTRSVWGQMLRGGTSELIDQPQPIGRSVSGLPSFRGTVGGLTTVAASISPVVAPPGYFGDTPEFLRGTVDAPNPWDRT